MKSLKQEGAQAERDAMRGMLNRKKRAGIIVVNIEYLLQWLSDRPDRFNAKAKGLQGKKKK